MIKIGVLMGISSADMSNSLAHCQAGQLVVLRFCMLDW